VQTGETFSSIAIAAYGNANFYPAIMRANPNIDAQKLRPGMKINLPAISDVKPSGAEAQSASGKIEPTIDSSKEYRVQPGDSLYKISMKLYHRGDRAEKIYEANKAAIGDDMHRLKVGQVLTLPDPPASSSSSSAAGVHPTR
jgi:nucleoid-associated protein YgaU